jgi:putative salt-induced outer membrane protein
MNRPNLRSSTLVHAVCVLGFSLTPAAAAWSADAPPPPGWYSKDALSFVMTSGNSGTSTFGAKAEVKRLWTKSVFAFAGAFVRAENNDPPRQAVGTPGSFEVQEGPSTLKAAKYTAASTFDHKVTDRLAWQVGAGFDRDTFAGVKGRTSGLAGMTYYFANRKEFTLKAGAGATITHQTDVVEDPTIDDTFVGLRLSVDTERKFGANSSYVGGLAYDQNLQDTDDSRLRFANALAVAMNQRLALQVGLLFLYDHQPALIEVPLFTPGGVPTGLTVPARAATLDTTFTVSVVFSIAPAAAKP